jgi:adenine/guanine phosphoribosyltransferase-like PRPP-binding protein
MSHHSSYIRELFAPKELKRKVNLANAILKQHPEIKAIACAGVSGIGFVSALSVKSGLPLVIVRK